MGTNGEWVTICVEDDQLKVARVRARVIRGPDAGLQIEFGAEPVLVGAAPQNQLHLTDPRVSGLHCQLRVDRLGVRVVDPGSSNGTWLGPARVREAIVPLGTEMRVGDTLLVLESAESRDELELPRVDRFGPLLGATHVMRELYARLSKIARVDVPVLVRGETGAGKELVAQALHETSARAPAPFVAINCGAIPATLMESELFGHEKGAFTGADSAFVGAFERAEAGTLFLDEIGEVPQGLQSKLLRVLDSLQVRRLGGREERPVRARIVAATNRDLPAMVAEGAFRADLYYRLAVAEVTVPPLRDRADDIPLLVEHLLERHCPDAEPLSADAMSALIARPWPGNVRELRNAVLRLALLGDEPGELAPAARPRQQDSVAVDLAAPYKESRDRVMAQFRSRYLEHVLDRAGGNVSKAARLAGVDRMTLYRLMDER